ncbi:MAG TPA: T9SS type A sorting domain-containing protein [Bacteroidota bacterium]|nr:T9SS type A sorting domain-containing protein [Bacteroidota bacterium]
MLLIGAAVLLAASIGGAQWSSSASVNTTICTGNKDRSSKQIVSDGSGGLLIAWYEDSTGGFGNTNVQRLNASGTALWAAGGLRVCTGVGPVEAPAIASDGAGGALVAWKDSRDGDTTRIYAQRVSAAGQVQWAANGVNVSGYFDIEDFEPQMVSDGAGGAFVSWDGPFGVHVVRVNAAGTVLWRTSVVAGWGGSDTRLAADSAGGVIVAWTDDRGAILGTGDLADIYAQRLNGSGAPQWHTNGTLVCNATNLQNYPHVVNDGSGGAIIAWEDFRNGSTYKGYAQRISAAGNRVWIVSSDSNGVALCKASGSQDEVYPAPDGSGGGIFSWDDSRISSDDIYAQRVGSTGQLQWDSSGVAICTNSTPQANPRIAADGGGGAYIIWDDNRNLALNQDIYAQRVNGAGQVQWTANGIAVCSASANQNTPLIVQNGSSGFIAIWDDYRNGGSNNTHPDYYAQRVNSTGTLTEVRVETGTVPGSFVLAQNYPNPFNPTTTISYHVPLTTHVSLKVYDVLGREVAALVDGIQSAGTHTVHLDGSRLTSGVYFCTMKAEGFTQTRKLALLK